MRPKYTRARADYARALEQFDEAGDEITRLLDEDSGPPNIKTVARLEGLRMLRDTAYESLQDAEEQIVQAALDHSDEGQPENRRCS